MSCSNDSLSIGQSIVSSFEEISLKGGIDTDDVNGHEVDYSSEVAVAPPGDSASPFEFTGLIDGRVQSGKGDEAPMGVEIVISPVSARNMAPVVVSMPSMEVRISRSSMAVDSQSSLRAFVILSSLSMK